MALLLFNVGVEIGQLVVVATLLASLRLIKMSRVPLPSMAAQLPVHVMGVVSAYWLVDRVASLLE